MTVIAWDGTTLAADKRTTLANLPHTTTKIIRAPNGALVGVSGDSGMCRTLRNWYSEGAAETYPDKDSKCDMVVILPGPCVLLYQGGPHPIEIEDACYAMGSGRDYALMAMHLGRDAREAVALTSAFDVNCGNGIDTLTLD